MSLNRLFILGFLLVVAGIALVTFSALVQSNVSTGGFILIGPIPVVFGTGSNGWELAILSVLAGGVMVLLLLVMAARARALTSEGRGEINK